MPALFIFALFIFGGFQTYTMAERKHRQQWFRVDREPEGQAPDPFRRDAGPAKTRPVVGLRRAPKIIRRTALWSMYMGQMAIPGGLLGLFGLLFGGLGLISIPGMILAVRIYRLGYRLLRRDPTAQAEAEALATFAIVLNATLISISYVAALLSDGELAPVAIVVTIYAAISFAHAQAMRRCARILAADQLLRTHTATQVAAEAQWADPPTVPMPAL